jgi:hypothetical protein
MDAPHLPLRELDAILDDVTEILGALPPTPGVSALEGRSAQCRMAIGAARRSPFSTPLLRALSAKVLELESDALVLRRSLRGAGAPGRFGGKRRGPRGRSARARSD